MEAPGIISLQGCTDHTFGEDDSYYYRKDLEIGTVIYFVCKASMCNNYNNNRKLKEKIEMKDIFLYLEDVLEDVAN